MTDYNVTVGKELLPENYPITRLLLKFAERAGISAGLLIEYYQYKLLMIQ